MMDFFDCVIKGVDENMQEELIEVKRNGECNYKFERDVITELHGCQRQQNSFIEKCGLKWLRYCFTFQPLILSNVALAESIKF